MLKHKPSLSKYRLLQLRSAVRVCTLSVYTHSQSKGLGTENSSFLDLPSVAQWSCRLCPGLSPCVVLPSILNTEELKRFTSYDLFLLNSGIAEK